MSKLSRGILVPDRVHVTKVSGDDERSASCAVSSMYEPSVWLAMHSQGQAASGSGNAPSGSF